MTTDIRRTAAIAVAAGLLGTRSPSPTAESPT
ncbi:hypothetical protein ABIA38_006391 [Embleya sp. AB8]